jgi:hypothetical protein
VSCARECRVQRLRLGFAHNAQKVKLIKWQPTPRGCGGFLTDAQMRVACAIKALQQHKERVLTGLHKSWIYFHKSVRRLFDTWRLRHSLHTHTAQAQFLYAAQRTPPDRNPKALIGQINYNIFMYAKKM